MRYICAVILAVLLALLSPGAAPAAFCRTPESVIAYYDHQQLSAEFFPLYGPAAVAAIEILNDGLIVSGKPERAEGDAVLIADPRDADTGFAYLFKDNCHINTMWIGRGLMAMMIGKGA